MDKYVSSVKPSIAFPVPRHGGDPGKDVRAQGVLLRSQCGTGHSVSKIGAQLKLASNTVSTYRARILQKTGTKNDVELALYAQRHGRTTSES